MTTKKPRPKTDPAVARHTRTLTRLNGTVKRITADVADHPSRSYVARAIRARSVDPKVIEKGFAAIRAALEDAEARYEAAQKVIGSRVKVPERVNLLEA